MSVLTTMVINATPRSPLFHLPPPPYLSFSIARSASLLVSFLSPRYLSPRFLSDLISGLLEVSPPLHILFFTFSLTVVQLIFSSPQFVFDPLRSLFSLPSLLSSLLPFILIFVLLFSCLLSCLLPLVWALILTCLLSFTTTH